MNWKERCEELRNQAGGELRTAVQAACLRYCHKANRMYGIAEDAFNRGEASGAEVGDVMDEPNATIGHLGELLRWFGRAPD